MTADKTKRRVARAVSLLTLSFFLVSQVTVANPGAGIEIAVNREMPGFLRIDIPTELASLDGIWEAPPSSDSRVVLHIQNAHANYGAQKKIKELLEYLNKTYAIKTIFVEGAAEDLNPDFLKLFPDKARNLELADLLAQQGELTGAELYLMETGDSAVKGKGIEDAGLYRQNYEALKKVFGSEALVNRYLQGYESRLEALSSKIFTNDLRRVLSDWQKFEKGHREFMPYVRSLAADAKRVLKLDLESLFSQVEWPQITRLLVLQGMEKDLDTTKALEEKDKLINFLKAKGVSPRIIAEVENFKEQRLSVRQGQGDMMQPRDVLEALIKEAGPKGFYFRDYPAFSLYAGYLILKSELDAKGLFEEIKVLFEKILDSLAAGSNQKTLLGLYRDEELARKLLRLELSRRDWKDALGRMTEIQMDSLITRLKDLSSAVTKEMNLAPSDLETKKLSPKFREQVLDLYGSAFSFYEFARQRESMFYEKINAVMGQGPSSRAVLITGGFHTDGMTDLFREHNISYGVLTPRLMEKSDEHLYRDAMLQDQQQLFDISYLELSNGLNDLATQVEMGVNPGKKFSVLIKNFWSKLPAGTTAAQMVEIYNQTISALEQRLDPKQKGIRLERLEPITRNDVPRDQFKIVKRTGGQEIAIRERTQVTAPTARAETRLGRVQVQTENGIVTVVVYGKNGPSWNVDDKNVLTPKELTNLLQRYEDSGFSVEKGSPAWIVPAEFVEISPPADLLVAEETGAFFQAAKLTLPLGKPMLGKGLMPLDAYYVKNVQLREPSKNPFIRGWQDWWRINLGDIMRLWDRWVQKQAPQSRYVNTAVITEPSMRSPWASFSNNVQLREPSKNPFIRGWQDWWRINLGDIIRLTQVFRRPVSPAPSVSEANGNPISELQNRMQTNDLVVTIYDQTNTLVVSGTLLGADSSKGLVLREDGKETLTTVTPDRVGRFVIVSSTPARAETRETVKVLLSEGKVVSVDIVLPDIPANPARLTTVDDKNVLTVVQLADRLREVGNIQVGVTGRPLTSFDSKNIPAPAALAALLGTSVGLSSPIVLMDNKNQMGPTGDVLRGKVAVPRTWINTPPVEAKVTVTPDMMRDFSHAVEAQLMPRILKWLKTEHVAISADSLETLLGGIMLPADAVTLGAERVAKILTAYVTSHERGQFSMEVFLKAIQDLMAIDPAFGISNTPARTVKVLDQLPGSAELAALAIQMAMNTGQEFPYVFSDEVKQQPGWENFKASVKKITTMKDALGMPIGERISFKTVKLSQVAASAERTGTVGLGKDNAKILRSNVIILWGIAAMPEKFEGVCTLVRLDVGSKELAASQNLAGMKGAQAGLALGTLPDELVKELPEVFKVYGNNRYFTMNNEALRVVASILSEMVAKAAVSVAA